MPTLPEIKKVKLPSSTFLTDWQTVIFRNYGYVPTKSIAQALGCDEKTVYTEACRLGLESAPIYGDFLKKSYITIIRNNWYLLDYPELLLLLSMSEERLAYILENEDFLSVKLGGFKPLCPTVRYAPLCGEQKRATEAMAKKLSRYISKDSALPFDFFASDSISYTAVGDRKTKRIVHGYLSPCLDPFATDGTDTLPDTLLERYQTAGVNGVWIHALLSSLSPYPFAPRLADGYEKRRENLNKLIKRCAKYGISVYLYMNEPRALPCDSLTKYDSLIGSQKKRTLCFEQDAVRDYLYNAVRSLLESAKELGGIFTITMSENPTHCNYKKSTDCPVCLNISPEISAAKVNNTIFRAIKDSGSCAELIANLWGWSPFMGWSREQIYRGIDLLDADISVMCVSEYDLEIEKGGILSRVIDYSISNPGPSEITRDIVKKALSQKRKVYAKIQASNSWECSSVPYIPVFDLVYEHLENLKSIGVSDLFLSWTLGGYPSLSLDLAAEFSRGVSLEDWYKEKFGDHAARVHSAIKTLCDAFRRFPFSIDVLYYSPKNLGCANLWDTEPDQKASGMVSYSFDDIEKYMKPYPYEVYVSLMRELVDGFSRGVKQLNELDGCDAASTLSLYAEVCLCHYRSDLLHTELAMAKRQGDGQKMKRIMTEEKQNTIRLLELKRRDARIGFEASNHYFYTDRDLIEKIVRMDKLETLI